MKEGNRPTGKSLRELLESRNKQDLGSIWEEQRRMQAEDRRIEEELRAARRKAKNLQRELRQHKIGDETEKLSGYINSFRDRLRKIFKIGSSKLSNASKKTKIFAGITVLVLVIGLISANLLQGRGREDSKDVLGQNGTAEVSSNDGKIEEDPPFEPMYPLGSMSETAANVTRRTPGGDIIHTFRDDLGGVELEVTQQEIPENFDLAEVAKDFSATSTIQIDDITVYHGYSEEVGVQSLFFHKKGVFVSIRAAQKITDDQWASYIVSLQ